jgi:hypothetical protein
MRKGQSQGAVSKSKTVTELGPPQSTEEMSDTDEAVPVDEAIRLLRSTACCSSETVKHKSLVQGHHDLDQDEVEDGQEEDDDRGCICGGMLITTGEYRTMGSPDDDSTGSLLDGNNGEEIPGFLPESGFETLSLEEMIDQDRKSRKMRKSRRKLA